MVSFREEIIEVLKEAGEPLHYTNISKRVFARGNVKTKGTTPEQSIYVIITLDIKKNGKRSPFIKTKKGHFRINPNLKSEEYSNPETNSLKRNATEFERKIKKFLEKLEFHDVDGARDNFIIGGHQVDVCAGQDNVLLVIECKMAEELKRKNLKAIIYELKGKIRDIQNGFKTIEKYKDYTYFRFILAINDKIQLRPLDFELANKSPNIYIWTEDFLEYYFELYNYLKPHAKYNLLGEMHISPVVVDPIQVPAFQTIKDGLIMYTFLINPKDLLKVTYVARREAGSKNFYQRIIKKDRLEKVRDYLKKKGNLGIFPNNIIISFERGNEVNFHRLKREYSSQEGSSDIYYGILEFPREYRSCWVIDGQHRLYAFADPEIEDSPIQVTAFQNLGIQEQGKLFLDINKNQKPVPPDLVWDLNGELTPNSEDGIISNAVKLLNYERNSPLYHCIYLPSIGLKSRHLSLLGIAGLCLSIKRAGFGRPNTKSRIENLFFDGDPEKFNKNLGRMLIEYFDSVKEVFVEDWSKGKKGFVLDDGGTSILIRLLEKIIKYSIDKNQKISKDYYKKYLKPVKIFLEKGYGQDNKLKTLKSTYFSSESSKDILLNQLCLAIRSETGEPEFGGSITTLDIFSQIKSLEREMGNFIEEVLKSLDPDWIKTRVPNDISIRLDERKNSRSEKIEKTSQLLTFGEERKIIERKDNFQVFKDYFIGISDGFGNTDLFFGALDQLAKYRNQGAHDKLSLSKDKEKQIELWIMAFRSCIKEALTED